MPCVLKSKGFHRLFRRGIGWSCFKIVCRDVGGIGLIDKHRKDVFANLLSDETFGI